MRFFVVPLILCFASCNRVQAEESADELLDVMRSIAGEMKLTREIDGKEVAVPLIEEPLTRYNDPSRNFQDGTMWGFGTKGERPLAMVTCYTTNARRGEWIHAMASLCDTSMKLRFEERMVWSPIEADIEFKTIEPSQPISDNPRLNGIKMRQISKRFTAHQYWDPNNQRFELRLLPTPAIRYRDEKGGVSDGMIFLFARNINPELCLLIESVHQDGKEGWRYGIAKIGSAEFHVELDGDEVWRSERAPGVVGRPQDAYAMFFSNRPGSLSSMLKGMRELKGKLEDAAEKLPEAPQK